MVKFINEKLEQNLLITNIIAYPIDGAYLSFFLINFCVTNINRPNKLSFALDWLLNNEIVT